MVVGDYICESLAGQRPANTRDGQRSDKTRPLAVTPPVFLSAAVWGQWESSVETRKKHPAPHFYRSGVYTNNSLAGNGWNNYRSSSAYPDDIVCANRINSNLIMAYWSSD